MDGWMDGWMKRKEGDDGLLASLVCIQIFFWSIFTVPRFNSPFFVSVHFCLYIMKTFEVKAYLQSKK
jgi:hypothetical protein